ncbi:hypothetical protein BV25DRAFT_1812354, partial [Artomyces pyxidatus]
AMWNAVYIFPEKFFHQPFVTLDDLRSRLDSCELGLDRDGYIADSEIGIMLNDDSSAHVLDFYDRNPSSIRTYYSLYAVPGAAAAGEARNTVASIVSTPRSGPIHGPALVVRNGPIETWTPKNVPLEVDEVARTLWWYSKSGNSVEEVAGERTLQRIFGE